MPLQQTKKLQKDKGNNGIWRQVTEWDKIFENYKTEKRKIFDIY